MSLPAEPGGGLGGSIANFAADGFGRPLQPARRPTAYLRQRCPVEESASPARGLKAAGRPVEYVEFAGGHETPPNAERTFAGFVTAD